MANAMCCLPAFILSHSLLARLHCHSCNETRADGTPAPHSALQSRDFFPYASMTAALENQSQDNLETSLIQVQTLLTKMRLVEELVHKQGGGRQDLVENRDHKQNLTELQRHLETLHPDRKSTRLNSSHQ